MEFLKTVIIGYVAMVVNYLLVLCFLPVLLVCGLCWIAGGVSMIFLIPGSIIMLLTGHDSGWRGIGVGLEGMFFSLLATVVFFYANDLRKKVKGKKTQTEIEEVK